jgi:hypothetical protein
LKRHRYEGFELGIPAFIGKRLRTHAKYINIFRFLTWNQTQDLPNKMQ